MATAISSLIARMMDYEVNPFQDVYVADSVGETEFARLFSRVPLQPAIHPVFNEGNVVLYGTQGCGKTMILRLLYPSTRIGFAEAREEFPVPRALTQFISAGVNLTKSAICDVAQVTLGRGRDFDVEHLPFYFADFFNWWILKDLFENLREVAYHQHIFGKMVNLGVEDDFVRDLVRQDCWFGTLDGCQTLEDVERVASTRVAIYRKWVSFNERHTGGPTTLRESKTAIGEPLSRTVTCLKKSGMIGKSVRVFIRVDQLEELNQLSEARNPAESHSKAVRLAFRRMLNRVFGNREGMVHYRIGTRRYGWEDPELLVVHGSGARLEHRRDYLLVDMDDALFRRGEHVGGTKGTASALFAKFARDAYRRRLYWAFNLHSLPPQEQLEKSFGSSPAPHERAEYYGRSKTGSVRFEQALAIDSPSERNAWSPDWRSFLQRTYKIEPLDAVLAAAWGRQTGGGQSRIEHRTKPPPKDAPWKRKQWWRKERLMQAVLQLAARRQQRLWWWGCSDILALSGGNISVFLHICHQIWDHFLNVERLKPKADRINPLSKSNNAIPKEIQAIGIQSASRAWLEKLKERPAGDLRRRFVEALGNRLRSKLREDRSMSYPGANGFSIARSDLITPDRPNRDIWEFLKEACGFGALYSREHTTKEKSGKSRLKFYLSPILSPHFQVPVAHQKEPIYWKMRDLLLLAKQAELPFMFDPNVPSDPQTQEPRPNAVDDAQRVDQLRLF